MKFKCANCDKSINKDNVRSCDVCWDMICKECFEKMRVCDACKERFENMEEIRNGL